ncbi:MAG: hypothetical protein U1B82_06400 [Cypionkella sp.]|nr:hypothetical protein [Cypionkella sp.]
MIDIYTAAVCANLPYPAPALPADISGDLIRLAAGLFLLSCVFGNLS